jgi:hypothetical protein
VFTSPASAHAPAVYGDTSCATDAKTWDANWKIGNDYPADAKIKRIEVFPVNDQGKKTGDAIDVKGAAVGDTVKQLSKKDQDNSNDRVKATSTVTDAKVKHVEISVVLEWPDGFINDGVGDHPAPATKTVDKPKKCTPETTPPTEETPQTPDSPPSDTPETPEIPVPTPPASTPPSSTPSTTPSEVKPILEFDCDTMTLGLENPADSIPLKLDYDTSKGEHRSVTVKPGDKAAEKFSAKEGFYVKLTLSATVEGKTKSDFVKVDYQKPADCDNSGQAGGLPVTGAAAGGIAGGAAVLLAAGGVLFVMARRRKVKFTA